MAGSSIDGAPRRNVATWLRRVTWSRVAFMAGLIVLGLVLVHFAGRGEAKVSQQEALAIARPRIDFTPSGHQIRFLRRGIPSHGFWAVTYYVRDAVGRYKRTTIVVVDASSGRVTEVRRTA